MLDPPAVRQGPPSRTPSAPANEASTGPALGLGCLPASLRQAWTAPRAFPPARTASAAVSRAPGQPATSSRRAEAHPYRRYRSERCPTIASSVFTARNPIRPGTPPRAPHTSAPTTASEVFSATDSTTARAICCASSAEGSRPHRCGSRSRATSMSPAASAPPTARASRPREVPPTTAQVAAAVRATEAAGRPRTARSATTAAATAPPAQTTECSAPHPRWSRHRRCSTAAAARPNRATGCPRRGSPSSRSPRRPAVAPYAKLRSARMSSAGWRRDRQQAAVRNAHGEKSSLRVSAPWFDVIDGESSWLPEITPR